MATEEVTTAIAVRDETSAVILTNAQLQMIANTSFVPAAFRGKVPEVLACVATGRALGLPDMTSLRGIHVIEGKATLSAELMDAIVRGHGHSITGTVDEEKAVARGRRVDNGDEMEAVFTLKMAEQAGLLGKSNWKRHPDDMMWARAVSKLCRRLFADCFAGATYVPEEMELTADEQLDDPPGTLTEPEEIEVTGRGGPTDIRTSGSASVPTPWETTRDKLRAAGVTDDIIANKAHELYAGRAPSSLTQDEAEQIWELAKPEPVQEVLA